MTFFTEESVRFWRELAGNNTKSWFDENRKRYESHLKAPYQALAAALVEQVAEVEPEYILPAAKATYRINRDTRFSEDKTPYKTELGITVGRNEKHDTAWPAYTVRISADGLAVAGGLYAPEPELRDRVRHYLAAHGTELTELEAPSTPFAQIFGKLTGDAHKRAPAQLKEAAATEPRVLNKQWVFWAHVEDPEVFTDPHLDQVILDHWEAARPVQEFLKSAAQS